MAFELRCPHTQNYDANRHQDKFMISVQNLRQGSFMKYGW